MTTSRNPHKDPKPDKAKLERELEEGWEETFPASDPVAVTEPGIDANDERRNRLPNAKGEFVMPRSVYIS